MSQGARGIGGNEQMLDFYQKLRKKIRKQLAKRKESGQETSSAWGMLVESLAMLPDLFHLAVKLLFDKEVPVENKGALIAALAYVVSPIDLIPDTIPVAGWIDDLIVMAMGLNKFFETDDEIVKAAVSRYWAGEEGVFSTIKHILAMADSAIEFLPKKFMKIIKSIFPK